MGFKDTFKRMFAEKKRNEAEQFKNAGNERLSAGDRTGAETLYRKALEADPDYPFAMVNLAVVCYESNRDAEAIALLKKAMNVDPSVWQAKFHFACVMSKTQKHEEALESFMDIVRLGCVSPDMLDRITALMITNKRFGDICSIYGAIPEIFEGDELKTRAGFSLHQKGDHLRALALLEGIKSKTDDVFFDTLSSCHYETGNDVLSLECLRKQKNKSSQSKIREGFILMKDGHIKEGFDIYEERAEVSSEMKMWNGEDLDGKDIHLFPEQGFGDYFVMSRFIPLLKTKFNAKQVFVTVTEPLYRLVETIPGIDKIDTVKIVDGGFSVSLSVPEKGKEKDTRATFIMSLPRFFVSSVVDIPSPEVFQLPSEMLEGIEKRVAGLSGGKPRIGLVWAGNRSMAEDRWRSISPNLLSPFSDIDAFWVSLQKDATSDEIAKTGISLDMSLIADCKDFLDTALLISSLDFVVAVDTSVANLACCLGKDTLVFNRISSEWRWMDGNGRTPWYPSATVLTQKEFGKWEEPISRAVAHLKERIGDVRIS